MLVSEEVWSDEIRDIARRLHLLVRARRTIALAGERNANAWALPLVIERTRLLESGELSHHLTRWLSSNVTQLWKSLRPDLYRRQ
jgi:hypothetical protein